MNKRNIYIITGILIALLVGGAYYYYLSVQEDAEQKRKELQETLDKEQGLPRGDEDTTDGGNANTNSTNTAGTDINTSSNTSPDENVPNTDTEVEASKVTRKDNTNPNAMGSIETAAFKEKILSNVDDAQKKHLAAHLDRIFSAKTCNPMLPKLMDTDILWGKIEQEHFIALCPSPLKEWMTYYRGVLPGRVELSDYSAWMRMSDEQLKNSILSSCVRDVARTVQKGIGVSGGPYVRPHFDTNNDGTPVVYGLTHFYYGDLCRIQNGVFSVFDSNADTWNDISIDNSVFDSTITLDKLKNIITENAKMLKSRTEWVFGYDREANGVDTAVPEAHKIRETIKKKYPNLRHAMYHETAMRLGKTVIISTTPMDGTDLPNIYIIEVDGKGQTLFTLSDEDANAFTEHIRATYDSLEE